MVAGGWRKLEGLVTVRLPNGALRRVELRPTETGCENQTIPRLDMKATKPFALCLDNTGYEVSLIVGKVYRVLPDKKAAKDDLVRPSPPHLSRSGHRMGDIIERWTVPHTRGLP
jgi:hypothetical protein